VVAAHPVGDGNLALGCPIREDEMTLFLQITLILSSVVLVLLVLLHRGRGGGLSSLFGGGMQSSLAGSSVAEKNLDRITLFVGSIWLICIIGTGLLVKVG
jgi:preprotein translocase subunit SecG